MTIAIVLDPSHNADARPPDGARPERDGLNHMPPICWSCARPVSLDMYVCVYLGFLLREHDYGMSKM